MDNQLTILYTGRGNQFSELKEYLKKGYKIKSISAFGILELGLKITLEKE